VDGSRAYTVADIDAPSDAPQVLVVPTHAGEYWIEHRADAPRRVIVRLVRRGRTIFLGAPDDRFAAPKVFTVTRVFEFRWLDRTRPTKPQVHGLDETVVWWTRSTDDGSGVAGYRVTLDGKAFADTKETRITLPELRGIHRLGVVAIDRAGNRSRPGGLLLHLG
jgi:hypothetical protein